MTTAHTATPIKTTPNGLTIVTDSHIGSQRFIATAENKKDAARIVAAWNAHDDLVKALEVSLPALEHLAKTAKATGARVKYAENAAFVRTVLAKATGGAK